MNVDWPRNLLLINRMQQRLGTPKEVTLWIRLHKTVTSSCQQTLSTASVSRLVKPAVKLERSTWHGAEDGLQPAVSWELRLAFQQTAGTGLCQQALEPGNDPSQVDGSGETPALTQHLDFSLVRDSEAEDLVKSGQTPDPKPLWKNKGDLF